MTMATLPSLLCQQLFMLLEMAQESTLTKHCDGYRMGCIALLVPTMARDIVNKTKWLLLLFLG
eukprot:1707130-Ditylum_brightwellii.AAC.1